MFSPTGLWVADFNGDGKPDIVSSDISNNLDYILTNHSTSGALSFAISYITVSSSQIFVFAADLNGDSKPDFVSLDNSGTTINVFTNISNSAPVVTVDSASSITATTASLNGSVYSGTSTAFLFFDYSTSPTLASGVTSVTATPATVTTGTGTAAITYSVTGLTAGTTYYFRARASNTTGTFNGSILSFTTPSGGAVPAITGNPSNVTACDGTAATFTVSASNSPTSYQWYANNGAGYTALSNTGVYSGVTTATLNVSNVSGLGSYSFQATATNGTGTSAASSGATLTVNALPIVTVNPSNSSIASGSNTSFSVTATGTGLTYQWKISTDGGTTYNNLTNTGIYTNVTTSTLNLTSATSTENGYMYECVVSGTCVPAATSSAATLTVTVTVTAPSTVIYIAPGTNVTLTGDINVSVSIDSFIDDGTYTDNSGSFNVVAPINFSGSGTTHFDSLVFNTTGGTSLVNQLVSVYGTAIIGTGSTVNANDSLYIRSDAGNATLINNGILTGNVQGLITKAATTSGSCSPYTSALTLNVSGTEMAYQWQSSADSSVWNNISGANSATYTATVSATGYYRCNLTTLNTVFAESTPGVKLTYTATPTITLGTSPSITEGATSANLPYSATTNSPTAYNITYDAAAHLAGLSDVTTATLTATPILLTVPAVIVPATYNGSVTVTNGCVSTPVAFTLTILSGNTAPTFDGGVAQTYTVCENAAATAINSLLTITDPDAAQTETYSVTSAPLHGSIVTGGTITSGTNVAPSGYTYQPTSGYSGADAFTVQVNDGHGGIAATVITVTVNPTPVMTVTPSSQSACNNANTSAEIFSSSVSGTTYTWANNNTTIGIGASGSGSAIASFTATNVGSAPTSGVFTVTPQANSCLGPVQTFTITVNPTPIMSVTPTSQTVCNNANTSTQIFSSNVSGTTYTWANNNTTIGIGASGSGSAIASFTATNVGSAPTSGVFTVTPQANSCLGPVQTFTITVNPTPIMSVSPTSQTVCNNANTSTEIFTSNATGTTYTWANNNTTIGIGASGSGSAIASFTATNVGSAPTSGVFTVTPQANSCLGPVQTFTITVNPTPIMSVSPTSQTVCNNANTSTEIFTSNATGTTYTWANNNTTIGIGASGSGSAIASFTATNVGSAPTSGVFTVTPQANSCLGPVQTFTITVNPTPIMSVSPTSQSVCNSANTSTESFGSNVAGTTFTWVNNNTGIGIGASGSGAAIASFTATNAGASPISGVFTVTPQANSCFGPVSTFTITVNPGGTVNNPGNQALCNSGTTSAINFTGTGAPFSWTNNNTSIGLAASGNGNIAAFTATNTTSAVVVATITVTASGSCAGSAQDFTITVNPTPNVAAIANQAICNSSSTTAVNFTGSVTATYTWTNDNSSIGLASSGTGNIASFTAINTGTAIATATVTVTPSVGGCTGASTSFTITVNPTPDVAGSSNQNICNGGGTIATTFSGTTSGTTYNWTNSAPGIGLAASGSGDIASFTAINTTSAIIVATVAVTPTDGTCTGASQTFTIQVDPTPQVAVVSNQTLCNNTNTTAVALTGSVTGTTFNWTNSTTSIGLAASGSGNIAAFTATNSTSAAVTATITVTPTANGCAGTPQNFMITVNPTPSVTAVSNQTLCNNATTTAVTFSGTGSTYSWTNSASSIGLASSGNGNISTFTATNTTSSVITATITVTPSANSCTGTPQSFTITVNPTPSVTAVSNQTLCNNATTTAVAFSGTGSTYSWTNSASSIGLASSGSGNISAFTATNTTSSAITGTITVTPSANSCIGAPAGFTITVNPTPGVAAVSNQTLCNGASTAGITFSNTVSGTTYNWTNSDPSIGLAASGTGDIAAFTAGNSTSSIHIATITVTPSANSCTGALQQFTITVNPTPDVNGYSNQSACNNTNTTAITFGSSTTGATYSWTNSDPSIGLGASGTGSIAAFTATNATSSINVATITVTPSANSCSGAAEMFTITVNPTPDVAAVGNQTVCDNTATTAVSFGNSVAGTVNNWTNSDASIGLAASGTGNIASFTATNATASINTATITVTPSANSCSGASQQFTITVNPTPDVNGYSNQSACNNTNTTAITFGSSTTGATYSWTNSDPSIGLGASGTGSIAAFTATNATSSINVATITVTPSANSCSGAAEMFTITVNPTPDVAAVGNQTVCDNTATTAVSFGNSVAGTVNNWTNSDASIGLAASGTGNIASFTATNATASINTATITVTPSANSCSGASQQFTITVDPTPGVSGYSDQSVCNNATTTAVSFASSTAGTTYSWTNSDASIGLAASGSGNIAAFTATNTTSAINVATISVTPSANSCSGAAQMFTITVNPTPDVAAVGNQSVCNNTATTAVSFSNSVAGTTNNWTNSGPSIGLAASGSGNIGSFTATNATSIINTATITVTPSANSCSGAAQMFTITVNPTPDVTGYGNQVVCNNTATTDVDFGSSTTGTTFAWTNSDNSIGLASSGTGNILAFTATNATSAVNTATITVTPTANSCAGAAQMFTITVNPTPDVASVSNQAVCNNTLTSAISFSNSVAGTTNNWTNSDASIGLASSGSGNIAAFTATNATASVNTATITVTPSANSCTGASQMFTIAVNPTPSASALSNQSVCNGVTTASVSLTGSLVSGTTYNWTNSDASIGLAASGSGDIAAFSTTNITSAIKTATITVTPAANSCNGVSQFFTITVNPTPDVAAVSDQTVCNSTATAAVNFSSGVAGTTYSWTNNDATIGLGGSGNGNIASFTATNATTAAVTATITVTPSANGCAGASEDFTITVNPGPTVNPVSDQVVCNNASTTAISFSGYAIGTVFSWTNSDPSIGLAASGTGDIGAFTATNATSAANTATITVTPSNGACPGTASSFMITVNPTPDVTGYGNQTVCNNANTTAITFGSSTTGTIYSWTNSDPSIGLAASGAGNIPSFTAANATSAINTATITVTPTANSCAGAAQMFTITVNPTPDVSGYGNQTVCNNTATTAVSFGNSVSGTTNNWTNSDASIGLAASGTGNIASFTATNATASINAATITVTPSANSCSGASQQFTITVNPTPDVNGYGDQSVCNNAVLPGTTFGSTTAGTTYSWTNSDPSIGLAASGTGDISAFTAVNATSAVNVVTITVTPSANSCSGASQMFTITVNPTPDVAAISSQTVCNNTATSAIGFSNSVAGTTNTWSNSDASIGLAGSGSGDIASFTATNATTAINTATITVTPSANSCVGLSQSVAITVDPTPGVNNYGDQSVCNNAILPGTTFGSLTTGTTYSWTNSDPSIGLAASGTGDITAFTASNATSSINTATITVTPSANGCAGAPADFTISVAPTPDVAAIADQTLCNNAATTAIGFNNSVAGTVNTWTNSDASIGLAGSGSGDIASFTATNSTSAINTATITVTPSANSCVGSPQQFTITVNPTPDVNGYGNQSICNSAATTEVDFGSSVSGATYSWTNSDVSIGLAASGTGNILSFTATNATSAVNTATITVTPSANSCIGVPQNFAITVNPTPDVTGYGDQTVCNNTASTEVDFGSATLGTTYSWINSDPTIGLAASGSGNIASFTATNATTSVVTSTITVTPSANGCAGAGESFMITVNPGPTVDPVANQSVCNTAATADINFTGYATGTVFSWTNSDVSIGLAASGTGNIASFAAANVTSSINTATITVTPSNGACPGTPSSFTITVNPTPDVNGYSNQTVCDNTATTAVSFGNSVAGTVNNWTNSDASIGLAASGSGNISSFTATNATSAINTATITVTPSANSCSGAAQMFTITVNPTPDVSGYSNQSICNNGVTAAINFGNSVAGTVNNWTNSDVSIGLAASGAGDIASLTATNATSAINTATITVTPSANGCAGIAQMFTITVNPTPDVAAISDQTVCNNATTTAVPFTGSVVGTVYNWTNSDATIGLAASGSGDIASFTATNITSAINTATVTVTPSANTCSGAAQMFTITVNPTPDVSGYTNQSICNNAPTAAVTFGSTTTGTTYGWTNSDPSIGLAASGSGNIASFTATNATSAVNTATISVTPSANSCSGSTQMFTITVNPTPDVAAITSATVCNTATVAAIPFSGSVAGTVYNWANSDATIGLVTSGTGNIASFTATNATSAINTATITVTPSANGCSGSSQNFTITVNPTPGVASVSNQTLCNTTATAAVTFSNAVAGTVNSWTNSDPSIGLAASGTGNIASFTATNATSSIVSSTITVTPSANSCTGASQQFTITVDPTPNVTVPANQTVCNTATLSATFSGLVTGTTYSWTNSDASIGLAASGTGDIASFTATNITNAINTATITVTPSANSCSGTPQNFTITVNPTPDIAAVGSQTVCNTVATAAVSFSGLVSGTTYSWTNSNTTIGLAAAGSGNIASFTSTNATSGIEVATITVTPSANSCSGPSTSFAITVNPTPDVTGYAGQPVCNGLSTLAESFGSSVTGATYSWTNSNTTIGLVAAGTGDIASFTATNSTTAPVTATIAVTPSANGCAGAAQSFVYTVNPTPKLTTTLSPGAVCDSSLFNYGPNSATAGTTYTWSRGVAAGISNLAGSGADTINEYLVNTTANPVAVTYTDTLMANGCINTQNVTVTVNPKPLLSTTLTPAAICDSNLFNYGPASLTAGTVFTWSRAAITGIANAPASGADTINEYLVNTTAAPIVVTYVDTLMANGCPNTQQVMVTVNPKPNAVVPASFAICNGFLTLALADTGSVSGTTYSWTNNNISIGLAATGTGNIAPFIAADTLTTFNVATVTVTPSANGCTGIAQSYTITVNPTPVLTSTLTPTAICDSATFVYTSTSATAGTTYTWSRDTLAGIINSPASGIGNISEALINDSSAPVTVIYMDTLHANGCINTQAISVVVYPLPLLTSTLTATPVCNNTVFNYTPTSDVSGASYAWTRDTVGGISNVTATGAGDPAETLVNTSTSNKTAVYVYTVSANGCSGPAFDVSVTVRPTPKLNTPLTDSICSGIPFEYTPGSATTGTTFTWHRNVITGISNAAGIGSGDINDTLINTLTTAVFPVYNYTMHYDGCTYSQNLTLKVNPAVTVPVITTMSPDALCSAVMYQNFGASVPPATGFTYDWTAENAVVWATGNTRQYSLVNFTTPNTTAVVTLTALSPTTQCFSQASYSVAVGSSVAADPQVIYSFGQFICLQNDEDSYQWGYDDLSTLDSTLLPGEVNQNYINASPDPTKAYWVMVTHNGCMQKAYQTAPTAVTNVNNTATEVKIYPNPANDVINVDINTTVTGGDKEVEVLNLLGQRLYTVPVVNNRAQVNVSGLPGGTYLINCYRDGVRIQSAKFIKN